MKTDEFVSHLRKDLKEILDFFFTKDYYLTLVGGSVRDFFHRDIYPQDLDFEIRSNKELKHNEWATKLETDFKELSSRYKVRNLNYHVFRFDYKSFNLEFASPRLEHFEKNKVSHSNFNAEIFSTLDYSSAFKRRDFTVNAIGIEIHPDKHQLIDPFNGLGDLENKFLVPCSKDFSQDPVRFLRALRFSANLNLNFSNELDAVIVQMNLSGLTDHYLKNELFKTHEPIKFWHQLFEKVRTYSLVVPENLLDLETMVPKLDYKYKNLEEWLIGVHLNRPLQYKEFQDFIRFFKMPESRTKALISFFDLLTIFEIEDFRDLAHQTPSKALMMSVLSDLKDLYQFNKNHQFIRDYNEILTKFIPTKINNFIALRLDALVGNEEWEEYLSMHDIDKELWLPLKLYFHLKHLPSL